MSKTMFYHIYKPKFYPNPKKPVFLSNQGGTEISIIEN